MSLIDVETTEEALQADAELIEAVENLVETAAVSVKEEIRLTLEEFWQTAVAWFEWLFPLWLQYQNDTTKFWEDLQKLAFSTVLLALSFMVLTPSNSRRRSKRRQDALCGNSSFRLFPSQTSSLRRHSSLELVQIKSPIQRSNTTPRRPSSSICCGRVTTYTEEEETDWERFEKNYQSLLMSRYRRLLLPPECKLVEKPKRASTATVAVVKQQAKKSSSSSKKRKRRRKKRDRDSDEDQPARRLHMYAQNLARFIKSVLVFDYAGAGMALIRWIEAALRIRRLRHSNSQADLGDEDDDDDDESKASASVASLSVAGSTTHTTSRQPQPHALQHQSSGGLQTPDRQELSQIYLDSSFQSAAMSEEKKESPLLSAAYNAQSPPSLSLGDPSFERRRGSEVSLLSTPASTASEVVGEPDEDKMANLRLPLSASTGKSSSATTSLRPSIAGGKKKDLLSNYRSSSLLGSTIRTNTPSLSTSATSSTSQLSAASSNAAPHLISHSHSASSTDMTTIHRNHQEELDDETADNNAESDKENAAVIKTTTTTTSGKQAEAEEEEDSFEDSSDGDDPAGGRVKRLDSDFSGYFFDAGNTQESLQQMALEAPLPDKNGYIVGDEFLADGNATPVLVFVNSRSGPQQGHLLITQLRRLLNPIQVWDLGEDGSPESVLESFCAFRNLRILVCGGDGTVSWIIATLEKLNLKRKWPPIAILPLGTGNDLARIHGWGGGYNNESLIGILEQVADSYISILDRWELTIENRKGKVKEVKSFFNYLGVGADAQAALQVHMLRESKPNLFFSRVVNKAWYGVFGAEDIIKATCLNLPNEITLIADGVEVPLPPDSQGIILLNIDSYSGGVPFWATGSKSVGGLHGFEHSRSEVGNHRNGLSPQLNGKKLKQPYQFRRSRSLQDLGAGRQDMPLSRIDSVEDLNQHLTEDQRYERVTACNMPSSCQDGFLDIVSIRGAFHLGQIRVGLSNAQRLCQCREATIHIKRKVAVQIDGEPWRQNICTLKVKRKADRAIMLHKSEDKNGVETEVANLLDWAEERRLINGDVHYAMMKEFSRRIEHKTRQRRNKRDTQNMMFSLKRAIGSTGAIASSYDDSYGGGNYEYPS